LLLVGFALPGWGAETLLIVEPSKEFPRHSEGDIVELRDGSLCLVYTRFHGGTNDDSAADLVKTVSKDGGKTWSEAEILLANEGKDNIMSVSILRLDNGELLLFYLVKNAWDDLQTLVRRSSDEFATLSEPVRCTTEPGYHVVNNDRVVQLSSGRLIIPAAWHPCPDGTEATWSGKAIMRTYHSDDLGKTWTLDSTDVSPPYHFTVTFQEPGIVELEDGRLMMFIRTDGGSQYQSYSQDQGMTWTSPEPGPLQSPLSPASIERVPWSGELMAVWNDHSGWHNFPPKLRTPLCVAFSSDEGKSWSKSRVIEGDPEGWYCYTSITFVDDRAILSYCAGDREVGGLNRLKVTALSKDWIEME
jgi:Neuraminidase (sialidase)